MPIKRIYIKFLSNSITLQSYPKFFHDFICKSKFPISIWNSKPLKAFSLQDFIAYKAFINGIIGSTRIYQDHYLLSSCLSNYFQGEVFLCSIKGSNHASKRCLCLGYFILLQHIHIKLQIKIIIIMRKNLNVVYFLFALTMMPWFPWLLALETFAFFPQLLPSGSVHLTCFRWKEGFELAGHFFLCC